MERLNDRQKLNTNGISRGTFIRVAFGGGVLQKPRENPPCVNSQDSKVWSWSAWVRIPPVPLRSSVTSAMWFDLSGLVSSFVKWCGGGGWW